MTEKTTYAPGEPIWTNLSTPDRAASAAFYGALLGWTAEEPRAEFGGYANWLLDGRKVAGLMPLMSPEQPPSWTVYVCSDDADKTAALVEEAGGSTLAPPMDVGDLGRMAVFADPSEAVFGIWQPGTHRGSELVGQDGTACWFELSAASPKEAPDFYERVLGWSARISEEYVELQLAGTSVAGVTDTAQGTTGWLPYFAVADPAAAAQGAQELGGTVVLPYAEWPGGSCSIVRDPHGAVLGLLHDEARA